VVAPMIGEVVVMVPVLVVGDRVWYELVALKGPKESISINAIIIDSFAFKNFQKTGQGK
jgi:hypothetical protein